jgi:hypothetical protein
MASPPPCLPVGPIGHRTSSHYSSNGRAADTSRDLFSPPKAAPIRVGREGSRSLEGFRGGVKNWWSTLTMRASAAEYRSLHLRAHELLHDVPLYDVSSVDLPGGGSGRTIADIRTLESATPPSNIATFLYGFRYLFGQVFGWDREPMRPEDSFLERLSQRDRCESEITPGTPDGPFWVLYQFPGEALRETRNKTVHGFICTALVSSLNGYILYWGVYVRRASWLTRPYLVAIEPFRRVLYPAMLRRIRRAWIAAYVGMSRNDTAV